MVSKTGSGSIQVQVLSDLHGEMYPECMPAPEDLRTDADIVVVAGDTHRAGTVIGAVARMFPEQPVVVTVAGNHENYRTGMTLGEGISVMRQAAAVETALSGRTVAFMEDEEKIIDVRGTAVRVLGCTLWTDFNLYGDELKGRLAGEIGCNDHRYIIGSPAWNGHRLALFADEDHPGITSAEIIERHNASRRFLEATLARSHSGPTIVVTHHLPSLRSIAPRYKGVQMNSVFASNLDDLVNSGAALWIHGHTHTSRCWRSSHGTLVVCNPAGTAKLPFERENRAFNPRFIVDIRRGGPDGRWTAGVSRRTAKCARSSS
jgi:Icc-related predicted phosphoesterase